MPTRVRVNPANAQELFDLPGLSPAEIEIIVRFRAERGPIGDADQLARIPSGHAVHNVLKGRADFPPSDSTAPEAQDA